MILFFLKLLFFNFAYSFVVGMLMAVVLLPLVTISKSEEPGPALMLVGIVVGLALSALQGMIVASAVLQSLDADPARSSVLWFIVGLMFSPPYALAKSRDPQQEAWSGLGMLVAAACFVLCYFVPGLIIGLAEVIGSWLAVT